MPLHGHERPAESTDQPATTTQHEAETPVLTSSLVDVSFVVAEPRLPPELISQGRPSLVARFGDDGSCREPDLRTAPASSVEEDHVLAAEAAELVVELNTAAAKPRRADQDIGNVPDGGYRAILVPLVLQEERLLS